MKTSIKSQIASTAHLSEKQPKSSLATLVDKFEELVLNQGSNRSAIGCIPMLRSLPYSVLYEISRLGHDLETSHVIADNDILKVVLIPWQCGKISSIHGHPNGGGVFKVLQGSLEEMRYTSDSSPQLLSTSIYHMGGMAYIDDSLGQHAVGNPFKTPALSLHVYTRTAAAQMAA